MHHVRSSAHLARLVLAWFALTLCVAAVSPWFHSVEAMQIVCSEGGTAKLVDVSDTGDSGQVPHHHLDCPACLAVALPPPVIHPEIVSPLPRPLAQHRFLVAHIASLAGVPPPPRGPPRLA